MSSSILRMISFFRYSSILSVSGRILAPSSTSDKLFTPTSFFRPSRISTTIFFFSSRVIWSVTRHERRSSSHFEYSRPSSQNQTRARSQTNSPSIWKFTLPIVPPHFPNKKNRSIFQPAFQDNSGKENLLMIQCGYDTRFLSEDPRLLQLIFCLLLCGKRYILNTDNCAPQHQFLTLP